MNLNPKNLMKKITWLLITLMTAFLMGIIAFVIFANIHIALRIFFIVFSVLISIIILIVFKKLYIRLDGQYHELTLIHDVSASLNLSLDHDVLYRVNLYSIIEKLNFKSGILLSIDNTGNYLQVKYSVGLDDEYERKLGKINLPYDEKHNLISEAMTSSQIIGGEKEEEKTYEVALKNIFGFNNYVVIPLINVNKCIGALILNSDNEINIDQHRDAIITSTNYIASSLNNIILYEKLKKKLHENKKLNELASKFNSVLDLDKLMKITIEASVELIGGERGNIFLYEKEIDSLVIKSCVSSIPINPNISFKPGEGIVGKVFLTGEAYLVNDTSKDPNFMDRPDSPRNIVSLLDVPIKTQDKTIGVINIDNKPGGFDNDDKELLVTLSSHIGIATENAMLHKQLKRYNDNLERIVKRRTWQLNKAKNELERQNTLLAERNHIIENDLLMAKSIQQQLIPNNTPICKRLKISSKYIPMDKVGGDFYDFFHINNGEGLGFIISDVSGHGPAAAFITAMIKIACNNLNTDILTKPNVFMETINKKIIGYTSSNFITAFYAFFNLKEGKLSYSCAGHNRPLLHRKQDAKIVDLYAKGRVLGFMEDAEFDFKEINLVKGDRILFYTDGLSESQSILNEMYSEERIAQMLGNTSSENVNKAVELIYLDMLNWVKNPSRINDDVAIVIVDFEG